MMNGSDIKKAAITKAKQVANAANNAANGNGGQKRRKGQGLKPIITTEDQQNAETSPKSSTKMNNSRSALHFELPGLGTDCAGALLSNFQVVRAPPSLTTNRNSAAPHHRPLLKETVPKSQPKRKTRRITAKAVTIQ